MEVKWEQFLKKVEDMCVWLVRIQGYEWEAGRTAFNVSDCIMSMDIQKVPLVWNWVVSTRKLQIKIVWRRLECTVKGAESLQFTQSSAHYQPKGNTIQSMLHTLT